ncbi:MULTISPECIES: Uma2 family endonuclease [Planktothricoides]|nr:MULTISPECIES: Uma2 family endonuclease [Planktothricoides]
MVHGTPPLPDHTQLPDQNGDFVKNYQEPPQGDLLTDSITPLLEQLHPDGNYCIGRDCGIYWRLPEPPESPEKGAIAPDWFYVPHVPPTIDGQVRRSFVMWKETIEPVIALEFVSGNGEEERDKTPIKGKFWVYERAIQIPFYGIYEVNKAQIEMYHLVNGRYQKMTPNSRGHYPIEPLKVELGIWQGEYQNQLFPWLRWWDADGDILLTSQESTQQERQRAEQERQRANRLAAQLRALGVEPEV